MSASLHVAATADARQPRPVIHLINGLVVGLDRAHAAENVAQGADSKRAQNDAQRRGRAHGRRRGRRPTYCCSAQNATLAEFTSTAVAPVAAIGCEPLLPVSTTVWL